MESDRRAGVQSSFGPSHRILELAQHKTSKTIWATAPRDPEWPISTSALGAVPSARIQYLSKHKRDFSAREGHGSGDDEASFFFGRKSRRPSSKTFHYESIVRLSTPKSRSGSFQETGPPHSAQCESNCPIWHIHPRVKTTRISPRLLQLSHPKLTHPDFQSNSESVTSTVSLASRRSHASERLVQLSLPRLRQSNICSELGRPEDSIWSFQRQREEPQRALVLRRSRHRNSFVKITSRHQNQTGVKTTTAPPELFSASQT